MERKFKYGKIALVVFITVLIWVWADLAQDDTFTVPHATLSLAKSIAPSLWVSFDEEPLVSIEEIVLKGPASRIAEQERKLKEGETLEFNLDPVQEKMDRPDNYTLTLLAFLQKNKRIRQRGLMVVSCKPEMISVKVVKLVEKPLKVRCIDGYGITIKAAIVDPPQVQMFVPEDWEGERLTADVRLTPREIAYARSAAIDGTPQIELAPRQIRRARTIVKIKMPPEEEKLRGYNIPSATIGFVFSPVLQGKYRVELLNPQDMAVVRIKASAAAESGYKSQPFQILLYILDGDEKREGEQSKKVVYNLPEEFVRKDEIRLNQQPATARFKLVPLALETGPSLGP